MTLFLSIIERKERTCVFMHYEAFYFLYTHIWDWTITNYLFAKVYGIIYLEQLPFPLKNICEPW